MTSSSRTALSATKKRRILHTLGWVASGGVEQMRLMIARCLPHEDYDHAIVCQEASGALPDLLRAEGWPVHEIGLAPNILSPAWHGKAARIAAAFRPDIVHGAVIEGVALANGIGLRLPHAAVLSEETSDPVDRSWRGSLLMRAMCLRSAAVIAVSPRVGDYLRDTAKIPARKVRVINNAVLPPPAVTSAELDTLRRKHGLTLSDKVIGSVGRVLDSHKRFSDLIRALVPLRARVPRVKLLIVGDGPDLPVLRSLAEQLGMGDAVIFAGYQGEVRKFYPLMDIFCLASAHEAFGLVLVEAMLAGVPVVGTRVGGIPFVLDQGRAGRLVAPSAPQELADAIGMLLKDERSRLLLGEVGRRYAEQEFSADRYCRELDALYRSVKP